MTSSTFTYFQVDFHSFTNFRNNFTLYLESFLLADHFILILIVTLGLLLGIFAYRNSYKTQIYLACAFGLLILSLSLVYSLTAKRDLVALADLASENSSLMILGALLIVIGLLFKIGAVPFHLWLAPFYVLLFLVSLRFPKLALFYVLLNINTSLEVNTLMLSFIILSAMVGFLQALEQILRILIPYAILKYRQLYLKKNTFVLGSFFMFSPATSTFPVITFSEVLSVFSYLSFGLSVLYFVLSNCLSWQTHAKFAYFLLTPKFMKKPLFLMLAISRYYHSLPIAQAKQVAMLSAILLAQAIIVRFQLMLGLPSQSIFFLCYVTVIYIIFFFNTVFRISAIVGYNLDTKYPNINLLFADEDDNKFSETTKNSENSARQKKRHLTYLKILICVSLVLCSLFLLYIRA